MLKEMSLEHEKRLTTNCCTRAWSHSTKASPGPTESPMAPTGEAQSEDADTAQPEHGQPDGRVRAVEVGKGGRDGGLQGRDRGKQCDVTGESRQQMGAKRHSNERITVVGSAGAIGIWLDGASWTATASEWSAHAQGPERGVSRS